VTASERRWAIFTGRCYRRYSRRDQPRSVSHVVQHTPVCVYISVVVQRKCSSSRIEIRNHQ